MWKVQNNATGKKSKSPKINSLKVYEKEISDPREIANELNSYFCAIAKCIQNEDPSLKNQVNTPSLEAFIKEIAKPDKNFQFKSILPNELMRATQKQKKQQVQKHPYLLLERCSVLCV